MKTNSLPAVIMLTAGLIDCVISLFEDLTLFEFTKRLLLVLVIFYVLGCVVKIILDMNFKQMDDLPPEEESGETDGEENPQPETETEAAEEDAENIETGEDHK